MNRKKIGLYNPYLDMYGGGERYIFSIAEYLSNDNEVILFWKDPNIKEKVKDKFNIDLSKVIIKNDGIFRAKNAIETAKELYLFDAFFYVTDGSVFFSPAKKNFLIIQSPLHTPTKTIQNQLKLLKWDVLVYSNFMEEIVQKKLGKKANVLAPPIEERVISEGKKEDIILSVGRFFTRPHNKKQDILIEEFKKNKDTVYKGCALILAGGLTEDSGKEHLKDLQKSAENTNVSFKVNVSYKELIELYNKSKVYWHAAGFGEDLEVNPEKAEHFGMTTVEAMEYGCIPIVFAAGGQKEIVQDGVDGYLWKTKEELSEKTNIVLTNEGKRKELVTNAKEKAKKYFKVTFYEKLTTLLSK